jgi:glycosyltransferase involved in cell wall biosynthesis
MRWPSVGVVVPTRHHAEPLRRALAAIAAQDYPGRLRVVVVYDQATPEFRISTIGDRPVLVLPNWRTPGFAGARNTGILALDTELVAFCDDRDAWAPGKLTRQVEAVRNRPGAEFATSGIEIEYGSRRSPRLAGASLITVDDLVRARMALPHSSTFLLRRASLVDPHTGLGMIAEDAPGSRNEEWDLLLRAARRAPIVHVDAPLVRVPTLNEPHHTPEHRHGFAAKISSLRWMMARHPEISGCRAGAARAYGQLAYWSAANGNQRDAWVFAREAVRRNWWAPRAVIALAAARLEVERHRRRDRRQ